MTATDAPQSVKLPPSEWVKLATMVIVPAIGVLLWVGRVDAKVDQHERAIVAQQADDKNTNSLLLRLIEQTAELRGELRGVKATGDATP